MALLIQGLRGKAVAHLQEKLGIEADGIFGAGTEKALKDYQDTHGLKSDGKAGAETFMAMGLFDLVILKKGSKGSLVKSLQSALGVGNDGIFGAGTEKALKEYQKSNALDVDGLAGPKTLASLGVFGEEQKLAAEGAELWSSVEESTAGALDTIKGFFA